MLFIWTSKFISYGLFSLSICMASAALADTITFEGMEIQTRTVKHERCTNALIAEQDRSIVSENLGVPWVQVGEWEIVEISTPRNRLSTIFLKRADQIFEVIGTEHRNKLLLTFYLNRKEMSPKLVTFSNGYTGIAYQHSKFIYSHHLTPNAEGVFQLPGLPPLNFYDVDGVKNVDIPHPMVFNSFIGHDFFVPYTMVSVFYIENLTYARVISNGQFPIQAVSKAVISESDYEHDMIGHGLVMALARELPVWRETVDIAKRYFSISDNINTLGFASRVTEKLEDDLGAALTFSVGVWEKAVHEDFIKFKHGDLASVTTSMASLQQYLAPKLAKAEVFIRRAEVEWQRLNELKKSR